MKTPKIITPLLALGLVAAPVTASALPRAAAPVTAQNELGEDSDGTIVAVLAGALLVAATYFLAESLGDDDDDDQPVSV